MPLDCTQVKVRHPASLEQDCWHAVALAAEICAYAVPGRSIPTSSERFMPETDAKSSTPAGAAFFRGQTPPERLSVYALHVLSRAHAARHDSIVDPLITL